MKIAIIGSTGLLGSNLLKSYLYQNYDVRGFSRSHSKNIPIKNNYLINFHYLNNHLSSIFKTWCPDILINAVAIVNLQKCEKDFELAYNTNVTIAENLAKVAKKFHSYFIQISTDHYYNDTFLKHKENDETILLNNYAKTKYKAEQKTLGIYKKTLIVRTNIVGFRNNGTDSFFEWLLSSITNQEKVNLFSNMFTSPISAKELGNILLLCYKKKLNGIYNIAASEVISKFDFGMMTIEKFQLSTKNIFKTNINQDSSTLVKRALTLGLDTQKIETKLNHKMPTISETLDCLYKEYKDVK